MTEADKEGQRKAPILRFKGFNDDWEQRKLGEIGKVRSCKRIYRNQTSNIGEIPFYKIGTFGKEADSFISRELYEEYKEKFSFPQVGDVLISASGTLGRIVTYSGENAYFQDSNIVWLDNDNHLALNKYLEIYYQRIHWKASEGSTIKRLYNSDIEKTIISIPKRDEQSKISEYLKLLNKVIALYERKLKLLSQVKKYCLDNLFTEKEYPNLRFKGFTDAWEQRKLEDIVEKIGTGKSNFKKSKKDIKNIFPILGSTSIIGYDSSYDYDGNFILTARVGNAGNLYKYCGKAKISDNTIYIQSNEIEFSFPLLMHNNLKKLSFGSGRSLIKSSELKKYKVTIPNKNEKECIGNIFYLLDNLITLYENKKQNIIKIKKELLNTMFI